MLRLKRKSTDSPLEIALTKRTSFFSLDFAKGFGIALVIHLILFSFVKVALFRTPFPFLTLAPSSVEIDLGAPSQKGSDSPLLLPFPLVEVDMPVLPELPQTHISLHSPAHNPWTHSEPDLELPQNLPFEPYIDEEDE